MNAKSLIVFLLMDMILTTSCSPRNAQVKFFGETVTVEQEMPVATEAPPMEATIFAEIASTPVPGFGGGGGYPSSVDTSFSMPSTTNQMIIKDAQLELLVDDTDRTIERVTALVVDQGGYIISARSWLENDYKRAELRMGIPSVNFEDTLTYLHNLGLKVLNETLSGQDVSPQYTDLKSRLANLEATAARVREFLDEARTVEDSLRVNQALSDLEGQIEQIKGQMKFLEGRTAFSTITLSITPQIPTPTPTPTSTPMTGWNPGKTAQQASDVMVRLFQGTVDALIWIAMLTWPFVLIAVIVWLAIKQIRRKQYRKNSGSE